MTQEKAKELKQMKNAAMKEDAMKEDAMNGMERNATAEADATTETTVAETTAGGTGGDAGGRWTDGRRVALFLALTFVLTWAYEIGLAIPAASGAISGVPVAAAQLLVAGAMLFPAIGVALTRLVTREGFGGSMVRPVRFRRTWPFWLLGWFGPQVLVAIGAVLWFALNPGDFSVTESLYATQVDASMQVVSPDFDTASTMSLLIAVQLATGLFLAPALNVVTCFGEEWGWRGYMMPKLIARLGMGKALLAGGAIWGLWHLPLTVAGHNYGLGYPGWPVLGVFAMCCFCTATGVFLTYVTQRSGSCLPAVFAHGALNGFASAGVLFSVSGGDAFLGPAPTGLIGGAAFIVAAAVLAFALVKRPGLGRGAEAA